MRRLVLAVCALLALALPASANRLTAADVTIEVTSLSDAGNWRRVRMKGGTLRLTRVDDGQELAETLPGTEDHLRLLAAAARDVPTTDEGDLIISWRIRDGERAEAGTSRHDWRDVPPAVEAVMATMFGAEDWRP